MARNFHCVLACILLLCVALTEAVAVGGGLEPPAGAPPSSGGGSSGGNSASPSAAGAPTAVEPPTGPPELAGLPPEAWSRDVDALMEVLSTKHVEPFGRTSREALLAQAEDAKARMAAMSVPQRLVAMARLAAALGDQHTSVALDQLVRKARRMPLALAWFDDGVFVVAAEEGHAGLIGRRVTHLADRPIEETLPMVTDMVAVENEGVRREKFCQLASSYDLLHALGLTLPDGRVLFGFHTSDGTQEVAAIAPSAPQSVPRLTTRPDASDPGLPISRREGRGNYSFEVLPDREAVYLRFDRCIDERAQPFSRVAEEAVKAMAGLERPRMVIDLRRNMGGDSRVIRPLVAGLKALRDDLPAARAANSVVVLIGPRTQSSASMNALELKRALGATLVGEPTGQRPSHLGEVRTIQLPGTGLTVWYSTRRFDAGGEEAGETEGLLPSIRVPMTSEEWFAGRDPVLERALSLPRP